MARKMQPLDKTERPAEQRNSSNDAKEPANNLVTKSEVVSSEIQPGAQDEQHRAAEREYWRRQLRMAQWLNWITTGAVIGGVLSLVFIKQTLDATRIATDAARIQAEIARGQLELSERPWVTAEMALTRPFSTDSEVGIEVSVKNVGRSVAINVEVRAEIVFDPIPATIMPFPLPDPSEIDLHREILCGERWRQSQRIDKYDQLVLFPEQEGTIQAMVPVHAYEVKERSFQWGVDYEVAQEPFKIDMFIDPVLIGCVTYSSTFTQRRYATEFTRVVSSINHPNGYMSVGVPVPVENIRLKPHRSYGQTYSRIYID